MKPEHRKVLILFLILLLIPIGWQLFKYAAIRELHLSQVRIYVSKSDKYNWQLVFISQGLLMGRTITLAAVPEPQRRGNEIIVGDVCYEDGAPTIFVFRWSKDGTLIAILTNEAARGVEEEPYTGLYYTYAYDFLKNEIIKPPEKGPQADDPNIWNENVKQIKSLFDAR